MNKTICRLAVIWAAAAVGALLAAPVAKAQAAPQGTDRINVTLDDPSRPALVKASMVNGGITVKGYEGKEVIVEARPRNAEDERPSPNGMKRLSIMRTGLSVEEENNEVRISTDSHMRAIDLVVTVPQHTSLRLRVVNDGDIVVSDVDGEFDIDNVNGAVTLRNISGSAVAHALNGKLTASFVRVNGQKPMAFSSLNGDIDVTFPADLKATLSIRSDRGDVFSDFDVQMQATTPVQSTDDTHGKGGKYRVKIDKSVHGTVNGGGQEIQLTDFQGTIYIRKAGAGR